MVGATGFEQPTKTPTKPGLGGTRGTDSGTLADVFASLPPATQAEIMALVRAAGKK
jgi:hypothetical protein